MLTIAEVTRAVMRRPTRQGTLLELRGRPTADGTRAFFVNLHALLRDGRHPVFGSQPWLALVEFKRLGIAMSMDGPTTRLTVAVEAPTTEHQLSVGRLQAWLDGSGKTPRDQAVRVRLRQMLGGL